MYENLDFAFHLKFIIFTLYDILTFFAVRSVHIELTVAKIKGDQLEIGHTNTKFCGLRHLAFELLR